MSPTKTSGDGQAALSYAERISSRAGANLTVVTVIPLEREDAGCLRCRQSAAIWNHELAEVADEELSEAACLVDGSVEVDYDVARGARAQAISDAASRCGADLIVLPRQRRAGVRALFSRGLMETLSQESRWRVVAAPAAHR